MNQEKDDEMLEFTDRVYAIPAPRQVRHRIRWVNVIFVSLLCWLLGASVVVGLYTIFAAAWRAGWDLIHP